MKEIKEIIVLKTDWKNGTNLKASIRSLIASIGDEESASIGDNESSESVTNSVNGSSKSAGDEESTIIVEESSEAAAIGDNESSESAGDEASMSGRVGVVKSYTVWPMMYAVALPPSDLGKYLGSLMVLETGNWCDCNFKVGVELETFNVHKAVLAARSPILRALFRKMLNDNPHLLVAVDMYFLDRLKVVCEANLCANFGINTVGTTLALAEQFHSNDLKCVYEGYG
ncbi:hypothetical protein QQ045_019326 [Rhodiola kirilowii]